MDLSTLLYPLTAHPYQQDASYMEIGPCAALRPYVRCYWGTAGYQSGEKQTLVIPDMCVDVIFETEEIRGRMRRFFCGLNDTPYYSTPAVHGARRMQFGVRLYAWSAALFTNVPLEGTLNCAWESERVFPFFNAALHERLGECEDIYARVAIVETVLLSRLERRRANADMLNAVYATLRAQGNVKVQEIGAYAGMGIRQMERTFRRGMGMTPKRFASLTRYQNAWRGLISGENVHDTVIRLGYTDQAHLIHAFVRYHGIAPQAALLLAR